MEWARILAYITGTVDQELLLRNEYLAAENRILMAKLNGPPNCLALLAEAYAMLGQPVEGLNCLAEAAQFIETTEERYREAEVHRLRGDLLNATGERSACGAQ